MELFLILIGGFFIFSQNGRLSRIEKLLNDKDISVQSKQVSTATVVTSQPVSSTSGISPVSQIDNQAPLNISSVSSQPFSPPTPPPMPVPVVMSNEEASGRLLGKIGIAAVLVGMAFFLKYAFDNNWIGPAGRVMIGLILV